MLIMILITSYILINDIVTQQLTRQIITYKFYSSLFCDRLRLTSEISDKELISLIIKG